MATYLAFAAIGKYDIDTSTTSSGLPVVEAFERGGFQPAAMRLAKQTVRKTASVVRWLTSQWGTHSTPRGAWCPISRSVVEMHSKL